MLTMRTFALACGVVYVASCARDVTPVDGSLADATGSSHVVAPRPIAPLSTSTVTSQRPTFHWSRPSGVDGAQVDICRDRACRTVVTSFSASGDSGSPPITLSGPALYYWRLHGVAASTVGADTSAVWEFSVGARSAATDTSWGTVPDINGDGFVDVLVGEYGRNFFAGATYVYLGSATGVSATPATTLPGQDGRSGMFGQTLASAGDVNGDGFADVVVAAPGVNSNQGRAYVYLGSSSGLSATPSAVLMAPGVSPGAGFGTSVASAGDTNGDGFADVVIGTFSAGAAYVYLGSSTGLAATPATTLMGAAPPNGDFGISVASVGDVNGDGFGDIVIGDLPAGAGHAFIYLGSASGLVTTPAGTITMTGPNVAVFVGVGAGDVNGDGFADMVVGVPGPSTGIGQVDLYLGSAAGLVLTPTTTLTGTAGVNSEYGTDVGSAGDVDGDGYGDVIVEAFAPDVTGPDMLYVYRGSASGLLSTPTSVLTASSPDLDLRAMGAGDVNGDGLDDVVMGSWGECATRGRVDLYLGGATGVMTTPVSTLMGTEANGFFGISVAWRTGRPTHLASGDGVVRSDSPGPLSAGRYRDGLI